MKNLSQFDYHLHLKSVLMYLEFFEMLNLSRSELQNLTEYFDLKSM